MAGIPKPAKVKRANFKLRVRATSGPRAHFIHIGKTGGIAIKEAIAPHIYYREPFEFGDYNVFCHPHAVTLHHVPVGDKVFFSVRDPVSRFISGFNGRQRCDQPRLYSPWTEQEARVFKTFSTPNALAEALSSSDSNARAEAQAAMRDVRHFRSYWEWFGTEKYLFKRLDDLFLVMFQEALDRDFAILTHLLGKQVELPHNDVSANRDPAQNASQLTELGVANLRAWYEDDYTFLHICKEIRARSRW